MGVTALSFRQEFMQLVHRRFKLRGVKSPPTLNLLIQSVDRVFYRFGLGHRACGFKIGILQTCEGKHCLLGG